MILISAVNIGKTMKIRYQNFKIKWK